MSKYTAYTGMGILVLITIVAVTMAAFSMGCTENGEIYLTDDSVIVESWMVLTEDANASEVTMEQNDLFVLKLKENPTTGYSWNLTVPEGLKLIGDDFIAPEDEGLVGAGGIHEWKLQAETEGTYEISAIYKRLLENTTGDEDTFSMTVTVLASGEHDGEDDADEDVEIVESGTVLTGDANASEVAMEQNDLIVLKLKENPTTGYSWNLTVPEGLELVGDEFVIAPEDEGLAGAGGIHEWTLQAETEGTYEISAIYKRSWENTTGDEDTFSMTVTVLASGEHDGEDDADEDNTEYIIRDAVVDDIEIFIMESFPLQVSVSATGYLPDGCTVIDEENIEVTRDGNTFDVALKTKRPADAMCTQALEPFEVNIPLDVYGLESGVYTVDVNGVTDTFEFTMDNVIE